MGENQRTAFVKNLNRYMQSKGIRQTDIVAALGVSATTVSDWTTGKKYPRVDAMQRLADYLGVLISDLTLDGEYLRNTLSPALGSNSPAAQKLREIGEQMQTPSFTQLFPDKPDVRELVDIYDNLNDLGQNTLLGTARGLAANPDMKKDGASNDVTA